MGSVFFGEEMAHIKRTQVLGRQMQGEAHTWLVYLRRGGEFFGDGKPPNSAIKLSWSISFPRFRKYTHWVNPLNHIATTFLEKIVQAAFRPIKAGLAVM